MHINWGYFQKPSRYIGNEINSLRSNGDSSLSRDLRIDASCRPVSIALCFPDTYEIGMSHTGLKILYEIINAAPNASAERVFAPWVDYESFLRQKGLPLTSLENRRPLTDFDIVGFTLQYELSYTNVLNVIDLGHIPLRTASRGNHHPLIIAGGPCTMNPLPLSPFLDAFVIGDGEEVIGDIITACSDHKEKGRHHSRTRGKYGNREKLLDALSSIEGIYVPAIHSSGKRKIKKRCVKDLDSSPFPEKPPVPFTPIVHDRVAIEISRGCTRGCRFCQAGMIYRPLRERSLEKVLSLSQNALENTGHEEISFTSLNTGDYSGLLPLIQRFNSHCPQSPVAISLPSLRVGSLDSGVLKEIKSVRKTGFTIAPEAGTERLRSVINKDFTEKEYEETLKMIFAEGWLKIKLYFMIGLPTETRTDLEGIIDMAHMALKRGSELTGKRVNINVGISAFVPKPHTPFQWIGQAPYDSLRMKQDFLRKSFKRKGLQFKGQHTELSLLEAVFSRGDRRCSLLLEKAWQEGCRFDGWSEVFDFDRWLAASRKSGIDLFAHAAQSFNPDTELPWEFIDTGISRTFLVSEYRKAFRGEKTEDCRRICSNCGLTCRNGTGITAGSEGGRPVCFSKETAGHHDDVQRIRVRFSKRGVLKYLSHREVVTALFRSIRRAKIPLQYSKGYHPHPRISPGPALPVGVEGLKEYCDIEVNDSVNAGEVVSSVNPYLPEGLEILDAAPVSRNLEPLDTYVRRYEYEIGIDKTMHEAIHSFLDRSSCFVSRGKKKVDIRPMVEKARIEDRSLRLVLADAEGDRVRLFELLRELLQKEERELYMIPIQRGQLSGRGKGGWYDPLRGEQVWQTRS